MSINNKIFIHTTSRNRDIEKFLDSRKITHYDYSESFESTLFLKTPLLSKFPEIDVYIFREIDLLVNLKSKLKEEYPCSLYFLEFSEQNSFNNNRKLFYSFLINKKPLIDMFMLRYPAESFGVKNKVSLDSLSTKEIKFYKDINSFTKSFSPINF